MKKNKHISYPKIQQFRNVVASIVRMATFVGLDENGDAIYDELKEKPILTARGTVKLHGTNAGVCFNDTDGIYTQSRNNSFTLDQADSHMGFTFFVKSNEEVFKNLFKMIRDEYNIDTSEHTISVYGEWAGKGIQKNVAISELDKAFYMFGVKISKPSDPEFDNYWVDGSEYRFISDRIWNISEFPSYEVEIDFNNPKLAQNKFVEIVEAVENECPVAKCFGVSGLGEGVVWTVEYKGTEHRFKTKGDKHAGKSKVKTIKEVDLEKLGIINKVAHDVTPVWRLNQMFNEVTDQGKDLHRKNIGPFIKAVMQDVIAEDMDILVEAELEPKDITQQVGKIARDYFFEQEQL
jgi:hypothetical protein